MALVAGKEINIPTAIVMSVGLIATVVLAALGKIEMAVTTAIINAIINAFTDKVVKTPTESTKITTIETKELP